MMKLMSIIIFIISISSASLESDYNMGDQNAGLKLALNEINLGNEDDGYQILVDLSISGDSDASRILGNLLIYSKHECKQGVYFLMIASEKNHEVIMDLANLFKYSSCYEKSNDKYNKYLNIYKGLPLTD